MTGQNVTRYVRYSSGGSTSYGIRDGDTIRELSGDLFSNPSQTGRTVPVSQAKLLVPVDPDRVSKVMCLVDNYPAAGQPKVHQPHPFVSPKMQTSLIADGESIEIPPESTSPAHQGSLVVIIGKAGRNITLAEAPGLVFGVAVGNDVSELDWLNRVGGLAVPDRILAKACDTWGPLGTDIVTGIDYNNLRIDTRVNGQAAATGRTSEMNNDVAHLIWYIAHYMTLLPGDILYTGAPVAMEGKANIKPGDTVEVEIENVGKLSNPVIAGKASPNPWWTTIAKEMAQA